MYVKRIPPLLSPLPFPTQYFKGYSRDLEDAIPYHFIPCGSQLLASLMATWRLAPHRENLVFKFLDSLWISE
jgi:hypothetical protein